MTQTSLKRRTLPLTFAAVAAGEVLSSSPALATSTTKHTCKGSTVDERRGTVQVSIVVKKKKTLRAKDLK